MIAWFSRAARAVAPSPLDPPQEILERAALHKVFSRLPRPSKFYPPPAVQLDADQRCVDELRRWAMALEDKRVRAAYIHWIDYSQHQIDEAREALRTKPMQDAEQAAWRAKEEAERLAMEEVALTLPDPPRS